MKFVTDKQTLDDLNILGRFKKNSIFSLFNHTITSGASRFLENMFNNPLTDVEEINERKEIISFFEKVARSLPFSGQEFEEVENYLGSPESKNRLTAALNITRVKILNFAVNDEIYPALRKGLEKTIETFSGLKTMIGPLEKEAQGTPYHAKVLKILTLLNNSQLSLALESVHEQPLPFKTVFKLDYIFRASLNDNLHDLVMDIYELDTFITISNVARERGFVCPQAVAKEEKFIDIKGVYHPSIPNAVANDIYIGAEKKVLFLTGANMAGKSTFMKSFAVSVYLAHMGFPVAAKEMAFSLHDGIYTSINVPDNLSMGYSHFYAEVLRVKHVAEEVATDKQLVIIFDELFKGTNVKDAYDGTVSIVDAFSKRNGTFIISTHIMEAGEALRKENSQLFFKFLPTIVKGHVPTYPYILEDGITDDRQGMIIIRNEKILDIINGTVGKPGSNGEKVVVAAQGNQ